MAVIGIDLGTTNSLVAHWKDGKACLIPDEVGNVLFPSVVSFFESGEVAVGNVAKEQLVLRPDKTVASFKRHMGTEKTYNVGRQSYKPLELSALVLSELKTIAEKYLQEEIEEAVITVPAYFNDKQRSDTKKAAQIAGLKVERLINEPSAAALAYQLASGQTENNIVIFDFGGGTLDLSYVECFDNVIEIVAVAGDNMLGGDDVDECIYEYVCKQKGYWGKQISMKKESALRKEVEQKKRLLQQQDSVEIDGIELTNKKLFEISVPLFSRIRKVFLRLLEDAGVRISEVDDIIMVGGSSKLSIVQQFLTEILGKEPVVLGDADMVVALGAGTYAGIRERVVGVKNIIMTDVCPFTLGVESYHSKEDKKGFMCVLIERNSTLPCKTTQRLYTLYDFQEKIKVKIYQGEEYYAEENLFLGELSIKIPEKPAGKEWIDVEFIYDINGILRVQITNSKGERKRITLANQELSQRELEKYQAQMDEIIRMKSPWENSEYVELLEIVEQYYEKSVGDRRDYLAGILSWYTYNMNIGSMKNIRDTANRMKQIIEMLDDYEANKENLFFDGELKCFEEDDIEEGEEDNDVQNDMGNTED